MIARAPAKINLFLLVTDRRDDGYHLICTLFQKIALYDELEFNPVRKPGISLDCPDWLDAGRGNLVYRAAHAFYSAADIRPGIHIRLEKNIPAGGGLGGGSSDAAATLSALNDIYGRPLTPAMLHELAGSLGADCPFFLLDATAAIGRETGTELEIISTPARWFVLVMPDFGISTRWAYENFKLTTGHGNTIFDARAQINTLLWKNDLEQAVAGHYPRLMNIKKLLLDMGAEAAIMTGSGSTMFGVFPSGDEAREVAHKISRGHGDMEAMAVATVRAGNFTYKPR